MNFAHACSLTIGSHFFKAIENAEKHTVGCMMAINNQTISLNVFSFKLNLFVLMIPLSETMVHNKFSILAALITVCLSQVLQANRR